MNKPKDSIEILLVEDNPADALLIQTALEDSNIVNKTILLKDGAEALEYIFHKGAYAGMPADDQPKIIMLDLNMPRVSGIELLHKVREDKETQDIPVVVFTSSKDDPKLRECYRLGVKNYIVKPSDFNEFKKTIEKTINGMLLYVTMFGKTRLD